MAPKGKCLISVDLSQAESWIVAFLADEPSMKNSLMFGDIHRETAGNALFKVPLDQVTKEMRYVGKRFNHASAYRMGPERASQVINKDSDKPPYVTVTIKEARAFSDAWHRYYNLKRWWADIEGQLNSSRSLTTPYGRRRTFFAQWGNELFKEATAFVPQSTVADHFNGAVHRALGISGGMREVYRQLVKPYSDHKIINQSHDSCILEVPESVASDLVPKVKDYIRRPLVVNGEEFTIPVDAELGTRWGELEKVA